MSIIWLIGILFTYAFVDSIDNLSENPDKDTPKWFKFFACVVMWPVLLGGNVGEMIETINIHIRYIRVNIEKEK